MKPRTGLATEYSDGELVILDKDGGKVHQLNESASLIWQGLSEGLGIDEIADELSTAFELERDKAKSDVRIAVRELTELGLLEV